MSVPTKYLDTDSTLRKVYDSIEADIEALRSGSLKLENARVILVARKTQLRTAELALASLRLMNQFEQAEKEVKRQLKKAG